jgi:hypothetical protein
LPEVHAVRIGQQRHVHPVVHEVQRVKLPREFPDGSAQLHQLAAVIALAPQLDRRRAASQSLPDHPKQVFDVGSLIRHDVQPNPLP